MSPDPISDTQESPTFTTGSQEDEFAALLLHGPREVYRLLPRGRVSDIAAISIKYADGNKTPCHLSWWWSHESSLDEERLRAPIARLSADGSLLIFLRLELTKMFGSALSVETAYIGGATHCDTLFIK